MVVGIMKREWPREFFKSAFMAVGNLLNNKKGDVLFWEENLNSGRANLGLRNFL